MLNRRFLILEDKMHDLKGITLKSMEKFGTYLSIMHSWSCSLIKKIPSTSMDHSIRGRLRPQPTASVKT